MSVTLNQNPCLVNQVAIPLKELEGIMRCSIAARIPHLSGCVTDLTGEHGTCTVLPHAYSRVVHP